jgi:hypothetical protein
VGRSNAVLDKRTGKIMTAFGKKHKGKACNVTFNREAILPPDPGSEDEALSGSGGFV